MRSALVALLAGLKTDEWSAPTVCEQWDVKDVAVHLLGVEIGNISRRRDGAIFGPVAGGELSTWLNAHNEEWVRATRFIGNDVLVELLDFTGDAFERYLATLDLDASLGHVSWASEDPVPLWLDVAREYTERWVHQQQIRDATLKPGAKEPDLVRTVVGTLVHALPMAYRDLEAPDGTGVELHVTGNGGGVWHVEKTAQRWVLVAGSHGAPGAVVTLDDDSMWRLFTRNPHGREPAVDGDEELARPIHSAVAIVA